MDYPFEAIAWTVLPHGSLEGRMLGRYGALVAGEAQKREGCFGLVEGRVKKGAPAVRMGHPLDMSHRVTRAFCAGYPTASVCIFVRWKATSFEADIAYVL